jgi:hypothetical protein
LANEIDLAWAAGFIDGEGCINITKRYAKYNNGGKLYHSISLSANQISKEPLLKLQEMFGGKVRAVKPVGNRRPSFAWIIYTKAARDALALMLPYLKVKNTETNMVLTLNFSSGRLTEKEWVQRDYVETWLKNYHNTYTWAKDGGQNS